MMSAENRIYFDHAATTPLNKEVIEAMVNVMENEFGNPSSTHAHGRVVRTHIEDARRKVAKWLNCTPGEIFFTSGGTEADNMALRNSVEDLGVKHIITSPIEHHAVLHTAEALHQNGKATLHLVKLTDKGHVDMQDLERLLQMHDHALVSLMHVNNEIGNLLDIERVGSLCKQYHALFHCDTVQTIGHFPIDLKKLNIDFLACGAHKFCGPKGTGFIYINSNSKLHPMITGGSQERNMRAGTENVYGIVGLAKALEICYRDMEGDREKISGIRSYMKEQLEKNVPGIAFNGDVNGQSTYTLLSASFPPSPINEMLLFKLDIAGISASGGSACSSGSNVGSHVLTALGADPERATVRFSFGKQNTREEVDRAIMAIRDMFSARDSSAGK